MKIYLYLILFVAIIMMVSCKNDPIYGTKPVDPSFWQGSVTNANGDTIESTANARFPLEQFRKLGEANDTAGQRAMVNEYRKVLTANIVAHYPDIKDEKNIRFILGSGFARNVESGDGKLHSGKFRNELIIIINDPSITDTIFLACGNGMLSPIEDLVYSELGHSEKWRFTIGKGEGLAHHLPALQEWAKVAGNLKIPIKNKDGIIVSQETYLNFLGRYQTLLFEGDVIDLLAGKVFNKYGQEVDFDRRQAETKKANARAIAKAKQQRR